MKKERINNINDFSKRLGLKKSLIINLCILAEMKWDGKIPSDN